MTAPEPHVPLLAHGTGRALLPAPLSLVVVFAAFVLNLLVVSIPVYLAIAVKLLLPRGGARDAVSRFTAWMAQQWAAVNTFLGDNLLRTRWEIRGVRELDPQGQYLVVSNHQTWNDIYVLMKTFGRRAPFFKFFIKQELIWVPVLGPIWWGLDYPFMKRYTPEHLEKHPELRGKDLETTRRACEAFGRQPFLLLNFLEGTRFTPAKQAQQQSPYRHLLKPKSGGMAFTLGALGAQLDKMLDVTIVYDDGPCGFFDFMSGRMRSVRVDIRAYPIPADLKGRDYLADEMFRRRFQEWVGTMWADKDARITAMKGG